jgi:hypothetical protein
VRDAIAPQLPRDLVARMQEGILVEDDDRGFIRKSDVRVVERPWTGSGSGPAVASVAIDAPIYVEAIDDLPMQRSVIIADVSGHTIVTAIEILSPYNKRPGMGLKQYLAKREQFLGSSISLVEIDLVRAGDRTTMLGRLSVAKQHRTLYQVSLFRSGDPGMYLPPITLRDRLPTIAVPLRAIDTPVSVALQELIDRA